MAWNKMILFNKPKTQSDRKRKTSQEQEERLPVLTLNQDLPVQLRYGQGNADNGKPATKRGATTGASNALSDERVETARRQKVEGFEFSLGQLPQN